jgi:oligopeptide transport system permease protein
MYFLRRLLYAVPLVLVFSALTFLLVRIAPGGPFDRERAPASPEIERNLEAAYHLDEPIWKQYLRYFGLVWEKDSTGQWHHAPASFNVSFKYRSQRITDIIAQGLPVSMTLGGLAFCFAMGVGLPVGFFTAARRGRWEDFLGNFSAILAVCIPGLVIAPLLILMFAIKWKLLPVALWSSPLNAILPMTALGLFYAGKIARLFREGMISAVQS